MKIAYILADPGIGIFGTKGASVHAQEMIRAFRGLGHDVTVFATKRGNKYDDDATEFVPEDLRDLPVFTVPVAGVKGAAAREQATVQAARRMAAIAAEDSYDLIYERYSLFSAAGARLRSRQAAPLVVEVNAPLLTEQADHRSLHDAATADSLTRETFASADVISCVSEPVAAWVRTVDTVGSSHITVTPNGVNPERFEPSAGMTLRERPFTVGFLGTLKPWHGTSTLLEAFAEATLDENKNWRCQIIGDGPQREQLRTLSSQLGISDQVDFRGLMAPEDVPAALRQWDVAAAPYPDLQDSGGHYFSPLKLYEYMAAGLPVVASRVGEIPQVIDHGVTGILVPGSDPGSLAAALTQLAGDATLRRRMGVEARSVAEAQHSWVSRAEEVLSAAEMAELAPTPQVMH